MGLSIVGLMDPTHPYVAQETLRSTEYVECTKFWQEYADCDLRAHQDCMFYINQGDNCNPVYFSHNIFF